jgi:hypothetical protein
MWKIFVYHLKARVGYKLSKMYFFITVSLKMAELEEIEVETKVQIFS